MAPHVHNREYPIRNTIVGVLMIFVGIIACVLVLLVTVDWACRRDIDLWMPVYPNAELVAAETNFVRVRAMGVSSATYRTPDDSDTVRSWYTQHRRDLTSSLTAEGDAPARGLAATRYQILDDPAGDGTLIIQHSECAYD